MNVVYVYADGAEEWNCSEWRCAVPARALNASGCHTATLISLNEFAFRASTAEAACAQADVIVVQRNLFGPVLSEMLHWQAQAKVVIADFDDAYDHMPATNAAYPFWGRGQLRQPDGSLTKMDPHPLTQFKWGLRLAQAATTPSRKLCEDWNAYTATHYLPNYIDLEKYQSATYQPHDGVWIGWGGSLSHLQSFTGSGVLHALKKVCRARPQVKVLIHGNDRRIFEQLPIPATQKALQPWVPYAQWPQHAAQFDIGLAPLHGPYDERRSWIKVLEYMVLGIPWIASDGPVYADLRGYGALVKNSPAAWERALLDHVDHLAEHRARAAREPYRFGLAQSAAANVECIVNVYSQIAQTTGDVCVAEPVSYAEVA
jgi:glycosyltransferase involved in cell wall biosynthesis